MPESIMLNFKTETHCVVLEVITCTSVNKVVRKKRSGRKTEKALKS